jgi:hypothetical protein
LNALPSDIEFTKCQFSGNSKNSTIKAFFCFPQVVVNLTVKWKVVVWDIFCCQKGILPASVAQLNMQLNNSTATIFTHKNTS